MKSLRKSDVFLAMTLCVLVFFGCRTKESPVEKPITTEQIVVRISQEPGSLNPMLDAAGSSAAREIYQYIFVTPADFDNQTFDWKPVLLEELPEKSVIESGPNKGAVAYDFRFLDVAKWPNGSQITGADYLFSIKMGAHPGVAAKTWKRLIKLFIDVQVDEADPKKFRVILDSNATLNADELVGSIEVYPAYIYDQENHMVNYSLPEIKEMQSSDEWQKNEALSAVAQKFSSAEFSKIKAVGAGPYFLETWEPGQFIVLKRKDNYWGDAVGDVDQLEAVADRIVFQIIKDQTTAITLLKDGKIDVMDMVRVPHKMFSDLQADTAFAAKFDFYTPEVPNVLYMLMNLEDARLSDNNVRKALAHATNVERMIVQQEGWFASKLNSPIHFSKTQYYQSEKYYDYDIEKSISILNDSGWKDTDGNGIRDKVVNGKKEELSFDFHLTGSPASRNLTAIIKEDFDKLGVELNFIVKKNAIVRSENLIPGDFDFYISIMRQTPAPFDPYPYFHSEAIGRAGLNYMRYKNAEVDKEIQTIRTSKDEQEVKAAYDRFQEHVFADMPIVFLYSPRLRFIAKKSVKPVVSIKKPGYFVNMRDK